MSIQSTRAVNIVKQSHGLPMPQINEINNSSSNNNQNSINIINANSSSSYNNSNNHVLGSSQQSQQWHNNQSQRADSIMLIAKRIPLSISQAASSTQANQSQNSKGRTSQRTNLQNGNSTISAEKRDATAVNQQYFMTSTSQTYSFFPSKAHLNTNQMMSFKNKSVKHHSHQQQITLNNNNNSNNSNTITSTIATPTSEFKFSRVLSLSKQQQQQQQLQQPIQSSHFPINSFVSKTGNLTTGTATTAATPHRKIRQHGGSQSTITLASIKSNFDQAIHYQNTDYDYNTGQMTSIQQNQLQLQLSTKPLNVQSSSQPKNKLVNVLGCNNGYKADLQQQQQLQQQIYSPQEPSNAFPRSVGDTNQFLLKSSQGFYTQEGGSIENSPTDRLEEDQQQYLGSSQVRISSAAKVLELSNKRSSELATFKLHSKQKDVLPQQPSSTTQSGKVAKQLNRYKLFAEVARSTLNQQEGASSFSLQDSGAFINGEGYQEPSASIIVRKQSDSPQKVFLQKRNNHTNKDSSPSHSTHIYKTNEEFNIQQQQQDTITSGRLISRRQRRAQQQPQQQQLQYCGERRLSEVSGSPEDALASLIYQIDENHHPLDLMINNSQPTGDMYQKRQLLRVNPYKLKFMELQQKKTGIMISPNNAIDQNNAVTTTTIAASTAPLYRYCVGYGNNAELIKRLMRNREWWVEHSTEYVHPSSSGYNFRWSQTIQGIKFDRLTGLTGGASYSNVKQCVNHFEEHKEISEKDGLVRNLKLFCETNKLALFTITPATFLIDLNDDACELQVTKFANFFCKHNPNVSESGSSKKQVIAEFKRNLAPLFGSPNANYKKLAQNDYSKPIMQSTFIDTRYTSYIWLLKAAIFNRGRGIELFSSFPVLERLIKEYSDGIFDRNLHLAEDHHDSATTVPAATITNSTTSTAPTSGGMSSSTISSNPVNANSSNAPTAANSADPPSVKSWQILKSQTFVIQKYIERPMLIKGRKFDMRMFVLVTQNMDCHFYKCGYIRTASENYRMDDLDNQFIHLTNNAVQKYAKNYGEHEQGNILSLEQFEALAKVQHGDGFNLYEKVIPTIREICLMTLASVKKKLNANDRKHCFELFGYDFFIDEDYKVWLIEVNSNPSIEESNDYLRQFMPRLVDDTFKLTIDVIFPKPGSNNANQKNSKTSATNNSAGYTAQSQISPNPKEEKRTGVDSTADRKENSKASETKKKEVYSIEGHPDSENLWQFMVNLSKFNYANYLTQELSKAATTPSSFHPLKDLVAQAHAKTTTTATTSKKSKKSDQ